MPIKHLIFLHILAFSFLSLRGQQELKNQQADIEFDEYGRIFINTSINNKEGWLLFDTGSKSSYLADSLINFLRTYNTCISLGKQKLFDISEVKKMFSPSMLKGHTNNCIGIIGNNIIEKYTWDFDLENKTVHIGRKLTPKLNSQIPMDTLSIHYEDGKIRSSILVNDSPITVNIESASYYPLVLKGNIPNNKKPFFYEDKVNLNSLMLTKNGKTQEFESYNLLDYTHVRVGNSYFNNIATCYLYDKQSFIGNPIWHNYKRVIVYNNANKIIFIGKIALGKDPSFSASKMSYKSLIRWSKKILDKRNIVNISSRNKLELKFLQLNSKTDTVLKKITIYGDLKILKENKDKDNFYCKDSALINGKIFGKCKFSVNNVFFENFFEYAKCEPVQLNFTCDSAGYIYIDYTNEGNGEYMFFDTGFSLSTLQNIPESKSKFLYKYIVKDSNGIEKELAVFNVEQFDIGNLSLNDYSFKEDTSLRSFDVNLKTVGVIGHNIIKDYIWDFDMDKSIVTVYDKRSNPHMSTPDMELSIVNKNNVLIDVNGKKSKALFDTGCSAPVVLGGGSYQINNPFFPNFYFTSRNQSSFSENVNRNKLLKNREEVINIKLGDICFNEVMYLNGKKEESLIGMPFLHNYKRVILDYPNCKIYFMHKRDDNELPSYSVTKKSQQFISDKIEWALKKHGKIKINPKIPKFYSVKYVGHNNDTIMSKHTVFGTYIIKAKDLSKPVVHCKDSVKLPNGEMIYEKYQFNMNDEVWKAK